MWKTMHSTEGESREAHDLQGENEIQVMGEQGSP